MCRRCTRRRARALLSQWGQLSLSARRSRPGGADQRPRRPRRRRRRRTAPREVGAQHARHPHTPPPCAHQDAGRALSSTRKRHRTTLSPSPSPSSLQRLDHARRKGFLVTSICALVACMPTLRSSWLSFCSSSAFLRSSSMTCCSVALLARLLHRLVDFLGRDAQPCSVAGMANSSRATRRCPSEPLDLLGRGAGGRAQRRALRFRLAVLAVGSPCTRR